MLFIYISLTVSVFLFAILISCLGLPMWCSGKESTCQCSRCKRHGFNPLVRKIPWRRKWQPTPKFLPRKFHGQRSLAGYSPWGLRVGHDWACMHTCISCLLVSKCFPVWKFGFFFFYCWVLSSFYILDTGPLLDMGFAGIFSHSVAYTLILLMVCLTEQTLKFCSFVYNALGLMPKN